VGGDVGLGAAELGGQISDALFPGLQGEQDGQPGGVGQDTEQAGGLPGSPQAFRCQFLYRLPSARYARFLWRGERRVAGERLGPVPADPQMAASLTMLLSAGAQPGRRSGCWRLSR